MSNFNNAFSSQQTPVLEIHDLTVSYNKKPVLYGIDLSFQKESIIGIMGPNGAGKSTLIKTIMGIIQPTRGWVKIFGKPFQQALQHIGYVPQKESVDWDFPINVLDVVLMGRYRKIGLLRKPSSTDIDKAYDCLKKVGMESFANRQIGMLSGGQQQRIFLARALSQESDLYLMDEPFVGVDAATESAIIDVMRELKGKGKTIIVVHHDIITARRYFDKIALINMRLVAFDDTEKVLQNDILQSAYGGRLNILSDVAGIDIALSE